MKPSTFALCLVLPLVAKFAEILFGQLNQGFSLVFQIDLFALLLIDRGVGLGIFDHALHLVVGEGGVTCDRDALLLATALVLRGHTELVELPAGWTQPVSLAAGRGCAAGQSDSPHRGWRQWHRGCC